VNKKGPGFSKKPGLSSDFMDIPTIETLHLLLRAWTPEDADAWLRILHEDGILRYFPNQTPPSREKADAYIAHHRVHWEKHGYGHWAVVMCSDGQVVGWNGLEYLPELDETEVAYLLSKRVQGRGYATEAARAAVQFGFETAGLSKIIGLVHPENIGSVRVLEKCGLSFVDRIALWGLEMSRYQIQREG
jgi:ribosomal-protein-alanine N-acetyltransferase